MCVCVCVCVCIYACTCACMHVPRSTWLLPSHQSTCVSSYDQTHLNRHPLSPVAGPREIHQAHPCHDTGGVGGRQTLPTDQVPLCPDIRSCMFVFVYVCVCACLHVFVWVCVHACMHVPMSTWFLSSHQSTCVLSCDQTHLKRHSLSPVAGPREIRQAHPCHDTGGVGGRQTLSTDQVPLCPDDRHGCCPLHVQRPEALCPRGGPHHRHGRVSSGEFSPQSLTLWASPSPW